MTAAVRRWRGLVAAGFLIFSPGGVGASSADGGQEAYDKGDYARAMSEWQSAADHGDADAELGLGKLYEFGLGDLAQSYKKADFWYRKAADQNNAEAEYRLALIWAVGGDNFPPDPTEAYKWLSLVLDGNSVWSTRAAPLKPQFERLAGFAGQSEAAKRVAAWREAHTAKPASASPGTGALGPAPATPAPAALPSAKCAGWPFPTLPCTEDFPAFPGTQPQKVVVPPIPAQNAVPAPGAAPSGSPQPRSIDQLNIALAGLDCASVQARASDRGGAIIAGTVADADQRAKLGQLVDQAFPGVAAAINVEIVPPPLCRTLSELEVMRRAGLFVEGSLGLRLPSGTVQLRQGELIQVEIHAPPYAVNLRIDYFSLDGQVLHLWPNSDETEANLPPSASHVYGAPGHKVWAVGGAPFGAEVITAIASTALLDLGGTRRPVEQAGDYLRDLKNALVRIRPPATSPNVVATLVVHTTSH